MTIYLVRHAKAGSRSDWEGDDLLRPLSKNGWRQAELLAERLAKRSPSALLTSPYLRCRQTLEPLARLIDVDIVDEPRLTEGERFEGALELIAALADGAVLCSHGDLIPDTIAALQRRGCSIESDPDWRKATVWKLERAGDTVVRATVWPPPL